MIGSILVPLDGSPFAEQALPTAAALARALRAKLRLVMVHEPNAPPLGAGSRRAYVAAELRHRRAERAYLKDQAERLRSGGSVTVATVVADAPVVPAIVEQVRVADVGLVVMTTHGRGPISRAWLGSVADNLVRSLTVPVLLVRPKEGVPASTPRAGANILVPLDGSPLAEAALGPAAEVAKALGLELTLAQVVTPRAMMGVGTLVYPVDPDAELYERDRRDSEDYLASAAEPLRAQGLRVDTAAAFGYGTVEGILELARGEDVAMVALSTHGRSGVQRLLLGSVADKLIRAAERPVLVIRAPRRRPTARPATRPGVSGRRGAEVRR